MSLFDTTYQDNVDNAIVDVAVFVENGLEIVSCTRQIPFLMATTTKSISSILFWKQGFSEFSPLFLDFL
jgi:hypothetical protein